MKFKLVSSVLAAIALALSATASFSNTHNSWSGGNKGWDRPSTPEESTPIPENQETSTQSALTSETSISFICETSSGTPITVARIFEPGSQKDQHVLRWVTQHFPDFTKAQELCQTVAAKLQNYYDNGELKNMSLVLDKGPDNSNQLTVCVEEIKRNCILSDRVLFTLETDNPEKVSKDIFSEDWRQQRIIDRGVFKLPFGFFPF
ncbi:MAG: COP23 domain-containing protein [Xenococcaceae cyanobacterium]